MAQLSICEGVCFLDTPSCPTSVCVCLCVLVSLSLITSLLVFHDISGQPLIGSAWPTSASAGAVVGMYNVLIGHFGPYACLTGLKDEVWGFVPYRDHRASQKKRPTIAATPPRPSLLWRAGNWSRLEFSQDACALNPPPASGHPDLPNVLP